MKRVVLWQGLRDRARRIRGRVAAIAAQLYTPRELRALLLFLLTGISILFFRFGKQVYFSWFPTRRNPTELLAQHRTDSLFHALSAQANARDSLFFSLPEDSLIPAAARAKMHTHTKGDELSPHSISLNLGTKEDLILLPSVGPASAERILAYRSERGGFRSLEELKNVHGIGDTRFERMKRYLKLN